MRQSTRTAENAAHRTADQSESAAGRAAREAREVIEDKFNSAKTRTREAADNAKEWARSKTGHDLTL